MEQKSNLINAVRNFKGLNYRQQIIFKKKDISIINDNDGAPIVFIHGNSEKSINISISHTNDKAIAFAILKEK